MPNNRPSHILPLIILAQFAGTSLWFAGNAILPDLIESYGFADNDLGAITSSVQFGFIIGTLVFALFAVADRFSPSKVFFACSALGSMVNLAILFIPMNLTNMVLLRFVIGILLAGIYPIGMKISADWFQKDLGKAIGLLVGALVIGTAFPHFLKGTGSSLDWSMVLTIVSIISLLGGFLILILVPDGPHRNHGHQFQPKALLTLFSEKNLRSAVFGYFGHMWELYTFWAFVPFLIQYYSVQNELGLNISMWSFVVIASGAIGCGYGGMIALKKGSAKVAFFQLFGSLICILLLSGIQFMPTWIFMVYMVVWGIFVVGDSPQFSTLAAKTAPPQLVGSALTIMNSIGFALTIPSIYLATFLTDLSNNPYPLIFLAVGPILGLLFTRKLLNVPL